MKFKIDKKMIYPALAIMTKLPTHKMSRVIEKDSLYIEVKDKSINLISYDGYEIYIEVEMSVDEDYYEEGVSRFEAKLFGSIIKSLNGEIYIEDTKSSCNIVNNRTRFELRSSAISDNLKNMDIAKVEDDYKVCKLSQSMLKSSLEGAMVSMGKDIRQLDLMNILMELDCECIRFISTDGYRLSVIEESYAQKVDIVERDDILLPSSSIPLINSFLKNDGEIEIRISKKAVCFIFDNIKMHIRRNDKVQYPDIRQILSMEKGTRVTVKRNALLRAIDQFHATGADIVTLKSDKDVNGEKGLKVIGNGDCLNEKVLGGEVLINIKKDNEINMGISFRGYQLRDGLKIIRSDSLDITVNGERDFIVMRPSGRRNMLYLVLPCML